jgi:hypothetical protein
MPVRSGSCLTLGFWPEGVQRSPPLKGRVLKMLSAERF